MKPTSDSAFLISTLYDIYLSYAKQFPSPPLVTVVYSGVNPITFRVGVVYRDGDPITPPVGNTIVVPDPPPLLVATTDRVGVKNDRTAPDSKDPGLIEVVPGLTETVIV